MSFRELLNNIIGIIMLPVAVILGFVNWKTEKEMEDVEQ